MAKEKEEIDIRSDEVQDIMNKVPGRIVRNGLSAMFILILIALLLSWFIKYPDIIIGKISLTTSVEPVKMVTQSSGVVKHIFVNDGDVVSEGTILAEIENPVSENSVDYLHIYLIQLEKALNNNNDILPLPDTSLIALGDLQSDINGLMKELNTYNITTNFKMDDVEIRSIGIKIENQKELINVNKKIIDLSQKELEESKMKYEMDEKLFKDSVISRMDYLTAKSTYRSKELQLEQLNQSQIDQKNALNSLEFQYKQSGFNKFSKNKTNLDAIQGHVKSIRSFIYGWQQRYNLTALKSGKVSFLQRIQAGNFLKSGEELFAIVQANDSFIGIAKVPTSGYGKIKVNQNVHILLDNFPYYDYGMLAGKVKSIALFPNTNEYRVEISLPDGMMSSQHQLLKFTPEMGGDAEIITENKRVLSRLFGSLTKAIKKR